MGSVQKVRAEWGSGLESQGWKWQKLRGQARAEARWKKRWQLPPSATTSLGMARLLVSSFLELSSLSEVPPSPSPALSL